MTTRLLRAYQTRAHVILSWSLGSVVLAALVSPTWAADYTTRFPLTEAPISENGRWISGKKAGLDWSDVVTTGNLAHGTQTGFNGYDDSVALLTGTWGATQTVTGTVRSDHPVSGNVFEEVELFVRARITPHLIRGYEINFRAIASPQSYCEVVRWNGRLGDFTYLGKRSGAQCGVRTGDIVKATVIGPRIAVYVNDVSVFSVSDSTWSDGNPGLGFFVQRSSGVNTHFGFTAYTASDGSATSETPHTTDHVDHWRLRGFWAVDQRSMGWAAALTDPPSGRLISTSPHRPRSGPVGRTSPGQ